MYSHSQILEYGQLYLNSHPASTNFTIHRQGTDGVKYTYYYCVNSDERPTEISSDLLNGFGCSSVNVITFRTFTVVELVY